MTNSTIGPEEIERRFGLYKTSRLENIEIRLAFQEFAEELDQILPEGRAKYFAFAELEAASMWCHKSIAELDTAINKEVNDGR